MSKKNNNTPIQDKNLDDNQLEIAKEPQHAKKVVL